MVSMDSSLAGPMNAQVFTMMTSASPWSATTLYPARVSWPSMTSESTRFLEQPRLARLMLGNVFLRLLRLLHYRAAPFQRRSTHSTPSGAVISNSPGASFSFSR